METSTFPPKPDAPAWASLSANLLKLAEGAELEELEELIWSDADDTCARNPLFWLQQITFTENPMAEQKGLKYREHFPKKSYFDELFKAFHGLGEYPFPDANAPRLFIPKTRDMMTSWAAVGYATHKAQWRNWDTLIQTDSERKAKELLDYAHQLYRNQPRELQLRHPLAERKKEQLVWQSGASMTAVPVGEDKVRGLHPTIFIMDEAAFLPGAEAFYGAVNPVAWQIIAISSAGPGWFGDQCLMPGDALKTHDGIHTWVNEHLIRIFRLHYLADPAKDETWANAERVRTTDPSKFRQEYEIDFAATAGELVYHLDEDATLYDPFPIPADWPKYMALDPHPRVPHAMLWCAVDPDGNRWYYRDYWDSRIYGKPGKPPAEDNQWYIWSNVEKIKYFESGKNDQVEYPARNAKEHNIDIPRRFEQGNPNNETAEWIYSRVIDYSARAMGQGTMDDPDQPNLQQRYEARADEIGLDMRFDDAKKDWNVGVEMVNDGLFPVDGYDSATDKTVKRSRIRISRECKELILELKTTRYPVLTAIQAENKELPGTPIHRRDHMVDCLRYLEMAKPEYIRRGIAVNTWEPINDGVNF